MRRFSLASVLLSVLFLMVGYVRAADALPTLVEIIDSKGFSYVGELLHDEGDTVTIFELRSGKERTIERSSIKEIKHDISDEAAIAETDLPSVMAWKVKKLDVGKPRVGKVAKVSDSVIYLTLGAKDGIAEGQKLLIYRNNGDITDPDTKKVIAQDRPRIAQVQITEAQDSYSKAKLLGDMEVKLQVGDECEIPGLKMCVAVFPLVDTGGKVSENGQAMTEDLTTSLVQHGVPVVERALLTQVLTELALQNTVLFDEKTAQQIGMQAGASCVLTGKIVTEDNRNVAHVRLIDVRTGKIMLAASERMRGAVTAVAPDGSIVAAGSGSGGTSAPVAADKGGIIPLGGRHPWPAFLQAASFVTAENDGVSTNGRNYVTTKQGNYLTQDFTFEIVFELKQEKDSIVFIGLGEGIGGGGYGEPANAVHFKIHPPGVADGGTLFTIGNDAHPIGGMRKGGTHLVRIEKDGDVVTFTLDVDNDGSPDSTYTKTVPDIRSAAPFLNSKNTYLFFGGGGIYKSVRLIRGKPAPASTPAATTATAP